MKEICVDLDNVLARTDEVMRSIIYSFSRGRVNLRYEDVIRFNYYECTDNKGEYITNEEWKFIHNEFISNRLNQVKPITGASRALETLSKKFKIYVVTTRPEKGLLVTKKWLKANNFNSYMLLPSEHRWKHKLGIHFDIAIDDDLEQALLFQENGTMPILLAHPWNKLSAGSKIVRLPTWNDIVSFLLQN